MVTPVPGLQVLYQLSEDDANAINKRRFDAERNLPRIHADQVGYIAHTGSFVKAGDVFPGVVVRVFSTVPEANLQVWLDGNDAFWALSKRWGFEPGHWTVP